jgi:hypothetical protein
MDKKFATNDGTVTRKWVTVHYYKWGTFFDN